MKRQWPRDQAGPGKGSLPVFCPDLPLALVHGTWMLPSCSVATMPRALQSAGGREDMPLSLEIRDGPMTLASGFSSGSAFD